MGRQINFYMSAETEKQFKDFLKNENFHLINTKNEQYIFEEDKNMCCCYKKAYGDLIFRTDNGKIDILESPVIEFSRTGIFEDKKLITRGRLWVSSQAKCKEDLIIKDYQKLVRWIKKNVPNQEYKNMESIRRGYISDDLVNLGEKGYHFTA